MEKKVIEAQPVPSAQQGDPITLSLYRLCYYFPQYTLDDAIEMPFHKVLAHLQVARQEKAAEYMELLNIQSVSTAKKPGSAIKKLSRQYKNVAEGG